MRRLELSRRRETGRKVCLPCVKTAPTLKGHELVLYFRPRMSRYTRAPRESHSVQDTRAAGL